MVLRATSIRRRRVDVSSMFDPPRSAGQREKRAEPIHLVWAVPLALLIAVGVWGIALFAWCGLSGCSGGGFGVVRDITGSLVAAAVCGAVVAVPFYAVRWHLSPSVRRGLAATVGVFVAGLAFVLLLLQ